MLNYLWIWLLSTVSILLTAKIVKGFEIKSFGTAMIASLVIGLLNATIRWVLLIVTLPINILTLGFFTFVVNACVLRMAAGLMKDFEIRGWFPAIIGAIVLAIVNMLVFGAFS